MSSPDIGRNVARLEIRAAAEFDLDDTMAFSAEQFGESVAEAYLRGFYEAFDKLAEYPLLGHLVPHIIPPTRCLTHRRHHIYYRQDVATVVIERILHVSMDRRRHII